MNIVNEGSHYFATIAFVDENGSAVIPDSGTYRIDDTFSKNQMIGTTSFTPSSSTHTLDLYGLAMAMVDEANLIEYREAFVTWTYASGTKTNDTIFNYAVRNCWKRPTYRLIAESGVYIIDGADI